MSSDAEILLRAKVDETNVAKVGVDSTRFFYELGEKDDRKYAVLMAKRWVVAQAILDHIAQNELGLSLRPLMPNLDFYTEYGGKCEAEWVQHIYEDNEWRTVFRNYKIAWPTKIQKENTEKYIAALKAKDHEELDKYNKTIRLNARSAQIIFGVQDFTPPELIAAGKPLFIDQIRFKRANIKIVQIEDIGEIRTMPDRIKLFTTPIMYKIFDNLEIDFHTTSSASDNTSNIGLLGIVAEPVGLNQVG